MLNQDSLSRIAALLLLSGPATVTGFVVAIIVNTLDCPTRGSGAHVLDKCCDRLTPAIANLNAPRSIPLVVRVVGLIAAISHLLPDPIQLVVTLSVNHTALFILIAAATFTASI